MEKIHKGNSLMELPSDFTVIDLETTGYSEENNEIIEMSAIKCRDEKVIDTFSSLVKPSRPISSNITQKTGITNEMVSDSQTAKSVLTDFLEFIGNDIVIGHNVNFDINFLYNNAERFDLPPVANDFVDTMRLSRHLYKDEEHHRLSDLCERYSVINKTAHRALSDCYATLECYKLMKNEIIEKYNNIQNLIEVVKPKRNRKPAVKVEPTTTEFDESNFAYGKNFVITGNVEHFANRNEIKQLILNLGGNVTGSVTSKTNYLINNDIDSPSAKNKKAKELNIPIISELEFLHKIKQ